MRYYDLLVSGDAREHLTSYGYSDPGIPVVVLEPSQLDKAYSPDALVFVRSSNTLEKNKKIVRAPCDGIVDPIYPRANVLDYNALTTARDNDITLVFTLSRFLSVKGIERAKLIARARLLIRMALKKGVRILLASGAEHPFDLRTPYQLESFGVLLGLSWKKAEWSITKTPEYLIRRKSHGDTT